MIRTFLGAARNANMKPSGTGLLNPTLSRVPPSPVNPQSIPAASTPAAITVTGAGFLAPGTTLLGTSFTLAGVACTGLAIVSDTSITCTTPAMTAGNKTGVLTNENGTDTVGRAVIVT